MRVAVILLALMGVAVLFSSAKAQVFIPAETYHISTSLSTSDYTGTSYYGDLTDDEDTNTLSTSERLEVPSGNPFPIIFKDHGADDEDTTPGDSSSDATRLAPAAALLTVLYVVL